jgi:ferredoxin
VEPGDVVVLDLDGFDDLIGVLRGLGFDTRGPVVNDGAIVHGPIAGAADLPAGWGDDQAPGQYRLHERGDGRLFAWAVGPASLKSAFFPPEEQVWQATRDGDGISFSAPPGPERPLAFVGARPCELHALGVLDGVLAGAARPDGRYLARREDAFIVVAECGTPSGTCFCTSMGSGPAAGAGFDLAVTELDDAAGHRFTVRVGTDRAAGILARIAHRPAGEADHRARAQVIDGAVEGMGRELVTEGLPALLARNLEHPRWAEVAERCLSCGNCTLVCPTCFCSDVRDTTDLAGVVHRSRRWASCFDLDHSYLHGGPVRASVSSRYRQWMTHKLSTWWDQFDTSGCVGCGRCVTWCPVGIDITEEAAAIRAGDGATESAPPGAGGRGS